MRDRRMDTDHQIQPTNTVGTYNILKGVREVRDAQSILKQRHGLVFCKVWAYKYRTNGMAKYIGLSELHFVAEFDDYMNHSVRIGDGLGKFTLKALETYETYFSSKLKFIQRKLKGLIPDTAAESCCFLAICLKNINIGQHVDYVIEMMFKLDDKIHPCVFLDSLFVTLKSCLPSFKFSSGAQLDGHRSLVVDFDTFMELEKHFSKEEDVYNPAKSFEILSLKDEDCKEDVKQQQFGTFNSTNLNNNDNDGGDLGVMDVRINVSASDEFEDLKMKISQSFDLVSDNDYRLTYSFKGLTRRPLWIELESDKDLKKCISLCRSKRITQIPIRIIHVVQHGFCPKSLHAILDMIF